MLNKYWNSPALALTVERSATWKNVSLGLAIAVGLSIYLVFHAGYTGLAIAMCPLAILATIVLFSQPFCGASIGWRNGQWFIFHEGRLCAVELSPGWVSLPWLVQFTLQDSVSKRRYALLLFGDSAGAQALQRLRRRLTLER
ncbi:MAG: hypothetical protein V7709_16960 [Halioglobus sp.]